LDTNLKGTFLCSQAAAKQMVVQARGGVIINIASIDAVHPSFIGLGSYDASKGGMLMFTKSMALEVARYGVRVMASDAAAYMTGSVVFVDGGYLLT
jgi:NAD(P)-dependent dehydrogenase (short-subunit alcohol dehydrogenase family)